MAMPFWLIYPIAMCHLLEAWGLMGVIPRRNVRELSFAEFDQVFLNRMPVILEGATLCPRNFTLDRIPDFCHGEANVSVLRGTEWAGLRVGTKTRDIGLFASSLRHNEGPPRSMFDLDAEDYCPSVLQKVVYPAHLVTVLASHWQGNWNSCTFPRHFGVFLSEKGFSSNLHVDSANTGFLASVCDGSRLWRIITSEEFSAHEVEFPHDNANVRLGDKLIFADLVQPYDTWGTAGSTRLADVRAEVLEGRLEPGELLYIPPGALHAAKSLENSLMLATNDNTLVSFTELREACDIVSKNKGAKDNDMLESACEQALDDFKYNEAVYASMVANINKHSASVVRKDTSLFRAHRCYGDRKKKSSRYRRLRRRARQVRKRVRYRELINTLEESMEHGDFESTFDELSTLAKELNQTISSSLSKLAFSNRLQRLTSLMEDDEDNEILIEEVLKLEQESTIQLPGIHESDVDQSDDEL